MKTTTKNKKRPLLILAILLLLAFVGLFVGARISRNQIKREVVVMKEEGKRLHDKDFDSRLMQLELRNRKITRIIGRDDDLEKWIAELRERG